MESRCAGNRVLGGGQIKSEGGGLLCWVELPRCPFTPSSPIVISRWRVVRSMRSMMSFLLFGRSGGFYVAVAGVEG